MVLSVPQHSRASLVYIFSVALSVIPAAAEAASIFVSGPMQMDPAIGCSITLSGQIETGDMAALAGIVDPAIAADNNYPDFRTGRQIVLCMQSTGGSFLEGLRLAEYLSDKAITTKVMPGGSCMSACALAFMGGNLDTRSGVGWQPSRYLHPTSRLGFHAPRLDLPQEGFTRKDVDRAYASALLAIGLLSQKANKLRLSQALLTDMVSHIGDDFELIDTVDDIAVNNIQMYGYDAGPMTEQASSFACWNAFRWQFHVGSFEHDLANFNWANIEMYPADNGLLSFAPFDGAMYCSHKVLPLGGGDKDQVIQSESPDLSNVRVDTVSAPWIRFPGNTLLDQIPLGSIRDF
jgi:ATP-dependent protease ClpP protease subunit